MSEHLVSTTSTPFLLAGIAIGFVLGTIITVIVLAWVSAE